MIKVTYYQPNAPDPILDNNEVLKIVKKYVFDVSTVDYVDETGGEARAYSIDNKVILKIQRPHRLRSKTSLEKEVFFLKELEKYKEIKVPYIYGYGKDSNIEYICMTKIEGKALKYLELSHVQRERILFDLGKNLYKIHSIDVKPFLDSKLFPKDENYEVVVSRLRDGFNAKLNGLSNIDHSEKKYAEMLADKLLKQIVKVDKFVTIHSNPAVSHTFVNDNFEFSGLIDFGDVLISHPVIDFKRWSLDDRMLMLKGYFSTSEISDNFQNILNVTNSLDNIIEILKNNNSISFIKDLKELLYE